MKYKEIILNELLDRYERSKSYLEQSNRRIIVKVDDIREYNIEDYDQKILFHNIVKELKNKNIIDFKWLDYEEENLMDYIWLIKENINKAYKEINRKNPKEEYKIVLAELNKYEFNETWINKFCEEIKEYMNNRQRENLLLPKDKSKEILIALKEIDSIQKSREILSMPKRVFSMKCYNDSKTFEKNIQKTIIKITRKYYIKEDIEREISDEEVLREIGIEKYPEVIEFCGNMKLNINGEEICYSDKTLGSYVNTYTIQNMENIEISNLGKIIFIENKTNYIEYIKCKKENEFVIYHGGFYSPIKGLFFKKIYEASKKMKNRITYYHWSDIDIGGFEIFMRLKENIIQELLPYKMDKNTLLKNKENCRDFDESYRKLLQNQRQNERYKIFFEVIDIMLENNIRLEQECLI